ncbi:unnamed protein product [Ectocarpus sp. 8 AP-2014]
MGTDTDNEGLGVISVRDMATQEDTNNGDTRQGQNMSRLHRKISQKLKRAETRWWCSSGARCEDSGGLELHRHPFNNDLDKCREVVEMGIPLRLSHRRWGHSKYLTGDESSTSSVVLFLSKWTVRI